MRAWYILRHTSNGQDEQATPRMALGILRGIPHLIMLYSGSPVYSAPEASAWHCGEMQGLRRWFYSVRRTQFPSLRDCAKNLYSTDSGRERKTAPRRTACNGSVSACRSSLSARQMVRNVVVKDDQRRKILVGGLEAFWGFIPPFPRCPRSRFLPYGALLQTPEYNTPVSSCLSLAKPCQMDESSLLPSQARKMSQCPNSPKLPRSRHSGILGQVSAV